MSLRVLSWSLAAATLYLSSADGAEAQITIGGSATNVSCFGGSNGSATAIPSGGTPPYTYTWSPGGATTASATGLSALDYIVTVTDSNALRRTRTYVVNQPPALATATITQSNVTSAGGSDGSATVGVSGGVPGYTYLWSPSVGSAATATGLTAGNYTVVVTDRNGCQKSHSFSIVENLAAGVSSVSVPADGAYVAGQNLDFTVNFSQAVTVDTVGGTPRLELIVGSTTRYAAYLAGSGGPSLTFRYTVQPGDNDSDGITISTTALSLNGGSIATGSSNVVLTLNGVPSTAGVRVVAAPPASVPTLTEWAMILLASLLALLGAGRLGLLPDGRKV